MKPTKFNIALAFAAVYVVWGSTYLAIRFSVETIPPFLMAASRFLVTGAVLYGFAALQRVPKPTKKQWISAGIVGSLLWLGGNGGVVWAEQTVPSGVAALLVATVPLWMVLIDWIATRRRPGFRVFAGLLTGLAGIWMLVRPGQTSFYTTGSIVLVFASLSWALGSVASKRLDHSSSLPQATGMAMLVGSALLVAASAATGELFSFDWGGVSTRSFYSWAYLIVFGSFVGFMAYNWLLRVSTIERVSTYAYVNPVVAVLLGWLFAGEKLDKRTMLAAAVILIAVVLIQTATRLDSPPET